MSSILVTNNPYVYERYKDNMELVFKKDYNYIEILKFVRDKIHEGYELLTHPLSGSVKPNETPYKTIMVSKKRGGLDESGLSIVEESILTAKKFMTNMATPEWDERVLDDFRVIDLSLIESVVDKLAHR